MISNSVYILIYCKAMLLQLESRNWLPYSAFAAEFGFLQHQATLELPIVICLIGLPAQ